MRFNLTALVTERFAVAIAMPPVGVVQTSNPKAPRFAKPGKNPVQPPDGIHFTPGNPIGVVAGVTWFF